MKFSNIALTLATAGSLVAAQPHRHQHRHVQRRSPTETEVVVVPGPTVVAYELNGKPISAAEVSAGIANGSLKWANGDLAPAAQETPAAAAPAPSSEAAAPPPVPSSVTVPDAGAQFYQKAPATSAAEAPKPKATGSTSVGTFSNEGTGADEEFPDGKLDCSTFPSEYGALYIDWLELDGWTGIQFISSTGDLIRNAVPKEGCVEGTMCSYACPAGYQKSQWPKTQGSTGQSIGGLACTNGKLRLTNPAFKTLCIKGTGIVNVRNELGTNAAVCRTDYPGTESETIPLNTEDQGEYPLTCPDANSYYEHVSGPTSAQYYVNPAGMSVRDACRWEAMDGKASGNWAPVNLGVGTRDGATFISIFQNKPTTNATLDFDIEIVGDNLGGGKCSYHNGVYTGATGSNADGCTVQVMSGTATYVFKPAS